MQGNLKTILHIGKIVCEVAVIALSIAALCTPAAGIVIAGVVVGAIAWSLSQVEDALKDNTVEYPVYLDFGHDNGLHLNQDGNNLDQVQPLGSEVIESA